MAQQDPNFSKIEIVQLLSRDDLRRRWKCGSPSFFARAERAGWLVARRDGGVLGYSWQDVWTFEGGPPPRGRESAWKVDLLTPEEVAMRCPLAPSTIIERSKLGILPCRRIGRAYRFIPAQVQEWLLSWQAGRG